MSGLKETCDPFRCAVGRDRGFQPGQPELIQNFRNCGPQIAGMIDFPGVKPFLDFPEDGLRQLRAQHLQTCQEPKSGKCAGLLRGQRYTEAAQIFCAHCLINRLSIGQHAIQIENHAPDHWVSPPLPTL